MFLRAGFTMRGAHRWNLWARVSVREGTRSGWACVLEFGSGDLAWYSSDGNFLIWGLRAQFITAVQLAWKYRARDVSPRSSLRTRKLVTGWVDE